MDGGLFTGGYIFRHRNNSSPDNGGKPNGIRSHRHPGDGASASCAHAKPQSSWWPSLKRTISERSRGEDSRLLLSWCGLCVGAAVTLRSTTRSNWGLAESTLAAGHRGRRNHATNGRNMALVMFYWDTGAQLITGQQGLGCPQKSRHRNPRPARGQQQKMSCYN